MGTKKENNMDFVPENGTSPDIDWLDSAIDAGSLDSVALSGDESGSGAPLPEDDFSQTVLTPEEDVVLPETDQSYNDRIRLEEAAAQELLVGDEAPVEDLLKDSDSTEDATPPTPRPKRPSQGSHRSSGHSHASSRSGKSGHSSKKRKRRKKRNAFKKALRTYVIILSVLIVAICAVLWVFLSRYQKDRDAEAEALRIQQEELYRQQEEAETIRRAPQKAFEAWLASTNPDYWTDLWQNERSQPLESREIVRNAMERHFSAAEPFRASEYSAQAPVYVLKEGDQTLARIYLSGSDANWTVSQVDMVLEGTESASVQAITGSHIYCNGVELGQEYVTDSESSFEYAPLSNQLVNPVSMLTYTVDGLLEPPVLSADPPEGHNLVQTEDGKFLLTLSPSEGDVYKQKAVDFVRAYLYYYMSGYSNTQGNLYYALGFLTQGTQAYSDLQDTYLGVVWNTAYANIDTKNTVAGDVVLWADNCCSVDVSYDAKCTLNGQPIDYATATMRIYFLKGNNGTFYISNFENL